MEPTTFQSQPQLTPVKLAISSYSYWHFREPKVSLETVIHKAAELGVAGVDILHQQMDSEDRSYLHQLKRSAFRSGIDLVNLSTHQNFVDPDAERRQQQIDHTIGCIELAYEMGIPCIRLNSGRWGTIASFDDLMANRGIEPPVEGYTNDDAFSWCIDSIEKCLSKAEACGVILALENHWGLTYHPEGVLRITSAIDSPWLGVLMDTGNFLEEPYDKLELLAPHADLVQAKTYFGGGEWYDLDLDYNRIARILSDANYTGYVSLEFEGKEEANIAVPQSLDVFRRAFNVA